ncbi:MAG: DUF4270 family protein [Bacteroidota bacterium]|nr:DUF4270 family protein [Bacteroidota bacterium]
MNSQKYQNILYFVLFSALLACNKEYFSVGAELYNPQFEDFESVVFPVYSYQESMSKVQTNNLPNVHLGEYNDDFYGTIESSFVSQLDVSYINIFGDFSQEQELQGSDIDIRVINEEEVLSAVYLDIPFFNNRNDTDTDGVIDLYDVDPNDSSSDSDSDGISDIDELRAELNPLSNDSDGDGILDPDDDDNSGYDSQRKVYEIDSLYGNRKATFDLKVYELTYYLNSFDIQNNFESYAMYYSDQDFYADGFSGQVLHDDTITLNLEEVPILYYQDDPETTLIETDEIEYYESPRIRVPLNTEFFQRRLMNFEGLDQLKNTDNFNHHLRGLIVKAENLSDDLYMLLDISGAQVVLEYNYNWYNSQGTATLDDDVIERRKKSNSIPLGGITVNHFSYQDSNQEVQRVISSSSEGLPSNKIFLQGSRLTSRIKLFTDNEFDLDNVISDLASQDIIINEANLIFNIDHSAHDYSHDLLPNRIYLYSYDNGQTIEDYNKDFTIDFNLGSVNANKYVFGGLLEYDSNNIPERYKFNITNHVNNIINKDSLNFDLGLVVNSDIEDITLRQAFSNPKNDKLLIPTSVITSPHSVVLHGSHPKDSVNVSKRLILEVLYTKY